MFKLSFGNHIRLTAAVSSREKIKKFYGEILGCQIKPHPDKPTDIVQFPDGVFMGINYEKDFLSENQALQGAWLELKTDDPAGMKEKLLNFGVREIEYPDKSNFYFQAPGGQVYRLARED